MQLWDSRHRKKILFEPIKEKTLSFYSCGPTVYNRVHIGNLRAVLFADTLQRYFRYAKNYEVQWVMNITDIDDKTIRDSQKDYPHKEPMEALSTLTKKYEDLFFDDIGKIGVEKSDLYVIPRATEYIESMQKLTRAIVDNGFGYIADGSVYFDVQKYSKSYQYGQLAYIDFEKMESTSRVEFDEYEKENIADFVLWKGKKDSEPFWDFEINGENVEGRPGWHIECSAMGNDTLGLPFDIHSGGVDLCFPHHEDEIAQAMAGYGKNTANYWVHNEHLLVDGKKMSKSLGNFYTLDDILSSGVSAEVLRFFFVTNHYRTKMNFTNDSLEAAQNTLNRIKNYLRIIFCENAIGKDMCNISDYQKKWMESMGDDLNVSVALSSIFECLQEVSQKQISESMRYELRKFVEIVENVFGISLFPLNKTIPEEILKIFEERKKAREDRDWKKSDDLRDFLKERGYGVKDASGESYIIVL